MVKKFSDNDDSLYSNPFKNNVEYWKHHLENIESHVKFYNAKSKNYSSKRIVLDDEKILIFLNNRDISKFNFFTAIFSLYLARTDNTKGCLLKTNLANWTSLLKTDYCPDITFEQYLDDVSELYRDAAEHTTSDIEEYVGNVLSFYSIFDLENGDGVNDDESVLALNIYKDSLELKYNRDIFSDEYIDSMLADINSLIGNVLSSPNQKCKDIEIALGDEKARISQSSKGFNEPCSLSRSQLNVYLDETLRETSTAYNLPFKIKFDCHYGAGEIEGALIKLFEAYPILRARVIGNNGNLPDCVFDAQPEISRGSLNDIKSFVRPFELDKCLSRFLIVDDGTSAVLCMDFHHLIFDATSINILLDKLLSILNGKDADLVDDGILRQVSFEENISSDYMDDAGAFIDGMLAGREEAYDLLSSVGGSDGFEYVDTLGIDNDCLTSFLETHSITHNRFFASVFAYTLSRFTGSSKALFNILIDGRRHIDLSESVGMFVKTLPVLIDCTNRDVSSFLDYSSDLIVSMMKCDLYPFNVMASEYDLNSNIVFQYSHDLYNNDKFDSVDELKHDLQGDLSFNISNLDENNFKIKILYSDKFSKEFIEQFAKSYKLILNDMMNVRSLSDIRYLNPSDLDLLDHYNSTENYLEYNDILDAFNHNLSKNPDDDLVSYGNRSYTYGQGAYVADKIAGKLFDLGVEPQDHVSFLVPRSELYMFSVLGILSAGAVYVPLDDAHPDERLRFILKDTDCKVVIVSDETFKRAGNLAENVVLLNISDIVRQGIGTLSHLPVTYDDLACILYTSGTTGIPKGVKITRKAIINFTEFYIKKYNLSKGDIFALFASISFDVSMEAIFSTICAGACLNIIPDDIKLNMKLMNEYFIENGVTYTHLPAQVAKLFIAQNKETSLEVLCTGGEKLGEIETNPDCRFIDSYGPTETFVDVTSIDVDKKIHSSSIGHLFDNVKAYVLDDELRRVPIGAVGELYLSGYQIAEGYLNREEETNDAFLDNPFDDCGDYNRLYRTGDMVRFLPDGSLAIVGRRDGQVKIRGNRVELSEVEAVIREISFIEDVTVQAIKNGSNNELVAYVVTSDDDSLKQKVCDYIGKRRPDYMVPSFVIRLDSIPLNVNGKVDKRALPEVDIGSLKAEYVAPNTEIEKIIVDAFEKVFNQEGIGVYDDFIRLGGDSLTAIKLVSYLSEYNISAAEILSLRTPKAISKNITEFDFDLDIYSLEKGCPLNEPQLNVYLDIIAHNKTDAYIIPHRIHVSKEYGLDNLEDALNVMIDAHPILGMRVSDEFEVPYLVKGVNPSISVKSNVEDDEIREFITKSFDLKESLCRFLIVENDGGYDLFGVFHHLIFDGLSGSVFERDLFDILDGKSVDFDDSFLKASAFNNQIKETDEYALADGFYESMLADIDDAGSLMESPCADGPGTYSADLDADVREFLDRHEISENVLFTGIFAYTLSRFVGSDEVLFNIVENGRDRFNNFDAIGMYVNTLPLFADCKNREVSSFINDISNRVYDVMRYNYYPFRLLAGKYGINSDIVFQFIPDWFKDDADAGESDFDRYVNEDMIRDMDDFINDFSVNVIQKGDGYRLNIRYSDKYSKDLIKRFSDSFKLILNEITNADMLSEMNYVASSDLELLDSFNQTETPLAYDDVLDAFNDILSGYPDNELVFSNNASYTYAEGAFISDRIAKRLMELGVKSQDNVAFLVERSELYMFSILSVLSIGAVYVPIDDNYPDERIKFILEDVGANVVLVSDETYKRAGNLSDNQILLNISDILKEDIGKLSHLPVSYGDLASILYTSGTTGLPKGVKITRKAILNFTEFYVNESGIGNDDVYGLFASIGFDVAIKGIFSSIYTGACLNVIPNDIKLDMDKLNKYISKNNISYTHITTQVAKLFINSSKDISLTELVTGGEKLGEITDLPDCRFVDTYGPTEACVYVTSINQKDKIDSSSVGHLLNNLKAYILDDNRNRVPAGAVGELYLSGYQIAEGYLNRPEETNRAFIKNPFTDDEGYETLYRTGDMARFLPDGSIDIVGRRDRQVKVRGNRVELSEVELVIREIDYIGDVTVQSVNNDLVAYVVLTDEADGNTLKDSISKYVGQRKPDYMIPSFIIELDSIPLTVNGKVDKRALPEVDMGGLQAEYVAPATENEKLIVEAFKKALNQDKISVNDDFLHLGGDSLTAIKLISYLKDFNISAADILSLRKPGLIAESIKENNLDLDIYSLESGCPLNESQLNVYLDIAANDKTDSFLIHLNMDISKEFAIDEMRNALDVMFEVHPILGMCISNEFEVPYLIRGSKPPIFVESEIDEEFLTEAFDLKESLCRFLIVENDDKYKLCAVFHHIIFDALSERVFKKDLISILNGKSVEVDDSFLKVSAFASQIHESDEYVEAKEFYGSMLVDADECGVLLDCPSSDGPGILQSDLEFDHNSLKSFLKENAVSENVLFTGVFAYTLSRFVGDDNVLFNIIENGRDRFNNFDSIGMHVNTLPMVIDCKNRDVAFFVNHVSDLVYDVMKYNYYPFRVLSKEYDIDSGILFQFMPEWINDENEGDAVLINDMITDMDDLISDFSADIIQKGEKYKLNIVYSDKYSKGMVERFAQSYKLILHQIISVDQLSDIDYTLMSDLEFLDDVNRTECPLKHGDVLDAFNDNLSGCPDADLVSYEDRVYSYCEGAFIAHEIANKLVDLGVNPQDFVGFLVERSEHYLFSILAILSVGAAYVPLDDAHPDERIQFMINDTDAKVIIVTDSTCERAESLSNDAILLNISDIFENDVGSLKYLPVVYGDLACILYTSGTTGIPKGVKITRKSILNLSEFYIRKYDLTEDDVYGLFASIGFDVGMKAIFPSICAGACLTIVPNEIKLNMSAMNDYFIKHGVTHTEISTQVAKLFTSQIDDTSLKVLTTGGEKLGETEIDVDYRFVDSYGPTEACVDVTGIDLKDKIDNSSIGFLLDNIRAYVLDAELRRVPVGAVGELYLAGNQIADGYLNRDEETVKAFLDNPFDDGEEYKVMYRTGDLVRVLADGSLAIVGRRDGQVKIRGNRVELPEVEAIIREIDYVEDVTVQTIKNNDNNELVAYVVVSRDLSESALRYDITNFVLEHKPEYMVPSFVVELDEIPLTVNGKVDKNALPEVDFDSLRVDYIPPKSEIEKIIVEAFEEVFNQKNISLIDNFVQLGGDSILAIRLISLLEKNNIFCSARDILIYKSPYLIAQNVKTGESIEYEAIEGEIDLLPIQSHFFDEINLENYSQHFVLKVEIPVDVNILQKALDELTNLHDMLRASYRFDENNNPIQEILPVNTRICEINEYAFSDELDKNIKDIFIKSHNSVNTQNKLIDINLVHYNDECYIIITIHHLIIDGVSWNTLLVDLSHIYFKISSDEEIGLTRPYPYKHWIEDVKELVENISDEEKQHWIDVNNQLDDSSIKGPANIFAVNVESDYDVNNLLMLSEEEYLALAIARAYKKTYDENIIFSRESHGRDDAIANLNRTIGWFTSEYPVPVEVSDKHDNVSLIRDVYNLKTAFNNVGHLGLNYNSLIYMTDELEYKHCPVGFNFLSREFVFKNKLFESINHYLLSGEEIRTGKVKHTSYGITFNIAKIDDYYIVNGDYAGNTYIGSEFDSFIENIKSELKFIASHQFDEDIVCCLSEPQLGIYLDEKANDKGNAYLTSGIVECDGDKSVGEIEDAIHALIDKHPILKGRILDTQDIPLLSCDSYPPIEAADVDNPRKLIVPFELDKSLARFFIINNENGRSVYYNIHHIISDAITCGIIENELTSALNHTLSDDIDLGFAYASNDSFNLKFTPEYESAHEFFKRQFSEIDSVQHILDDVEKSAGKVKLPIRGIRNRVESFAYENGITVSNLLNAVFAYAYSRFTGSEKVYYTFNDHGRYEEYTQQSVGMFIRTIPVIVDCKNKSVGEYLSDVSDLILTSMSNSIYPFRLVAAEFNLNNGVGFEYNYDLNDVSYIGDEIFFSDEADRVSEFSCVVNDLDDGYVVGIDYVDNLSRETVVRFVNVFKEVLTQFLDKQNLEDIDYISSEDVNLLDSYNETGHDLKHGDVLDAFNDNLSGCPDADLVSYDDRVYSYCEGAFIAHEIANRLVDLGVNPQDFVGFLVERSEHYLFSILAILSVGAAYVPLDDAHPDERIQFMINDTDAKVIIVTDSTCERAESLSNDAILLNISDIFENDVGSLKYLPVVYGDLACILYTSGTTGIPKGVKITRKSILNLSEFYIRKYDLTEDDVYGLFASIGFDVGMKAIFPSICAGACLTIVPNEIKLNMSAMNDYFIKHGVTHTEISTQVAKLFTSQIDDTSLKVLTTGGEKLGETEIDVDYRFVDSYGPTEACVDVTGIDLKDKIDNSSIGFLLDNIRAYVLDAELRRVPVGAVGELYLAGNQIAEGYLNREEETIKAFLDNPFDDDYDVMYRTGDLVRVLPDGSLAILGRRDGQVKIRGNRVELPEVEAIIREMAFVDDVTVQTVKNGSNHELIAYVVVNDECGDNALKENICSYVGNCKPDFMIPSFVVKLDEIPLTVNGKVDKSALPEVDFDSLRAEYVAPGTETEKVIVEAFEKVFNRENIGIYDDFIRLGGDSLTAIRLLTHIDNYNVTVSDILSLHTPHAIANNIKEFSFDLDAYSLKSGCPLNEAQLNVYLDIKANDKVNAYTFPLSMDIPKEFDIDDITAALNALFNAHPILGMCVSDEFEVPYLIKGSNPSIVIKSDVDKVFIKEFLNEPFDLKDSLCRFLIFENDDYYTLFGMFHHLIFDALSQEVFKRDLIKILKGQTVALEDSFLKSSAFSQQIQGSEEFDEANRFYESMLADGDECAGLLDEVAFNQSGILRKELELDLKSFKSFLYDHGISENVVFTSVFAYALSRFVGSDKVKFNIIDNGRDRFNNFDSIGMYVNTLPILLDCENQSVSEFMQYSSSVIYDVLKYNYYPFRLIANKYDVDSDILFQFIPDWMDDESGSEKSYNLVDYIDADNDSISDLNVNIFQKGNAYHISAVYSEKYSRNIIERFINVYISILAEIIKAENLSDINYISKSDLRLLEELNQTEHPLKYDDILDAFNDNLSKYPNDRLVSINDISYTYAECAFIANKIAQHLKDLGVKPQDCVAFLTERCEYYMFSILGILSMGGVYVPLDDALPDERIKLMINDTNACVIVSDETYDRVNDLTEDTVILNISDILKESVGSLSELPVGYGDLACILYTSGTTGIPKGVKVTRKSVLNLSADYCDDYNLTHDDVYGLFASIGFDGASWGILSAIYSGACLEIIPQDIRLDIDAMNGYFIKHNVTHTFISTQLAKLFVERIKDTSLNVLCAGGEKLGDFESPDGYDLIDCYGPTEAFVYIASCNNKDKIDYSSVGNLSYNTKAYILDKELRPVPIGAVGELYLAGYQVAEGYLNREKETKDHFISNPFTDDEDYNVLYCTGDMVRLLPDGALGIVGRQDVQVKIRGNRVELSEIEALIREITYVDDATVQTVKNGTNHELIAYVVVNEEFDDISLKENICGHVARYKPDFMVPAFVISLDDIPLNVNGKVDKHALPEIDFDSLRADYVSPTNDKEKMVVEAFEKVFNQEKIGIYDDFISLGGDSLTAIKLVSYLKDYNISVADVLHLHTPKAICENIKEIDFDLDRYSLEGCPLNEPQLNVYLDIIANDKADTYNIPVAVKIPKEFGIEEICNALDTIINAHPILGMCISDDYEVPYLIKGSKPSITIEKNADDEFIKEFLTEAFDLHDSLSRFAIVGDNDSYSLIGVFHHLVFDGLSCSVFRQDLAGILNGETVDFDDSFLKVATFNQQIKDTDEYVDAGKFYDEMLADYEEAGSLLDNVSNEGIGICRSDLAVDYDLLKSFLNKHGISENVLFTGVFAYTLSRFAGSDKVLFNIVENGRDRFDNYSSIGMYVTTLPILVNCKNRNVDSFMQSLAEKVYGVIKYNYYPFRLLSNEYDVDSNILFQFLPEWMNDDGNQFDKMEFGQDNIYEDVISDFSVDLIQNGKDYSLVIGYCEKYSKDFVERFMESYKLILSQLLVVDELSDIDYISQSDLDILDRINQTCHQIDYADVLDSFNDNLSRYPDNALVSFRDVSYTYSEGSFIACEIAKQLVELGVEAQGRVSFLVERSELYMFCVLGILSMGGVYVPLDDAHPDERIRFILKDTESRVVIVSDETYGRARDLVGDDALLLNISDIVNGEIGTLSSLPVVYGDLACILYTSGSTGVPKGVKITRKSILNISQYYADTYGLCDEDVYGLYASIGFDVATFGIFAALYVGACLSVVPGDIRLNMSELNMYYIDQKITHTVMTTQVAKLFITHIDETSLEVLLTGGEKLGEFRGPDDFTLVDVYGPTESFMFTHTVVVNKKSDYSSVGFMNYNVKAYILDGEGRQVPFGAVGELYLSGYQVAEGYLNRDEENENAFLENPFDDSEGFNVLYRTGDIVRFLPDESLGIVGRQDGQVKVRGNRVELPEVEDIIREMDNIEDVTVQTVKNATNYELVAYVVASGKINNLKSYICDYISMHKPNYMVPSHVIEMDEIPLNINGKVDKKALPEVDASRLCGEYVAPENDVEAFFAKCFEEILGIDRVGATDNFFEMGGDSLLVIKIIMEAINNGISINYGDVFDNPTPRLLSKAILSDEKEIPVCEDTYDYTLIDDLLKDNNIDSFENGKSLGSLGNVLLTGATGFLGIHLLFELLEQEDGDVYCLIRSRENQTAKERLASAWNYYFKRDLSEFEERIHVIEGDVTSYDDFNKLSYHEIDTVINSAANVKHYAQGSELNDINVGGTVNALKFAKAKNARFVQISTGSVAGERVDDVPPEETKLYETNLFINQVIDNKYAESKFLAERKVLEAAVADDLDVKIMRVGNLMARSYDSLFQRNYDTNAFVNNLKSFVTIGKMLEYFARFEVEFSAIDITAKSIVALAKTPRECCIFHPFSNNNVLYRDVVNVFNQLDLNIELTDEESFNEALDGALKDESKQKGIFGLVTRLNNSDVKQKPIEVDNEYTLKALSQLGITWPEITEKYMYDFIKRLYDLDFFNI